LTLRLGFLRDSEIAREASLN
jgi:hypothetical protein